MSEFLSEIQLLDIARRFGTPLYIYDGNKIERQYQTLKNAFSNERVKIFYACKALTNINILKLVQALGSGVDCSSINEAKLALLAGFHPSKILYTTNSVAFDEIEEAQLLGIHVNIDSLSNLEKFAQKFGNTAPVGIRLRPGIMAGGNLKISTGHDKSKFGIPIDDLDQIIALVKKYDLVINNLHIHTGSDIKDADVFLKGIEVLFDIVPQFPHLTSIDLGGGFKVAYQPDDATINIQELSQKVMAAFDANENTKHLEIWFEPGKFMVSEAGYFITRANVIKPTKTTVFVGVNSGFNHLIRPMFYDAYHRIQNITNPQGQIKEYTIVGNICETDTFAWNRDLPEIREGDLLVFYNAGAYGFEMSSNFNSRLKPAEVLVKDGEARLIRRRDEFEDLLRHQIV